MNVQPRELYGHKLVRASAGTGKTFQLSNRYLGLALLGEPVDQILSATFARKAAGEILQRILMRLAAAAESDKDCRELAEQIEQPELTTGMCRARLREMIKRLHRLRVSTLDAFFVQMAGSYSLELGLPAGWRIVDELDDQRLRERAVQDLLTSTTTSDLITLVNLLSQGETTRSITSQIHGDIRELYSIFLESNEAAWNQIPRHTQLTDSELAEAIEELRNFKDLPKHKSIEKAHLETGKLAEAGAWAALIGKGYPCKILAEEAAFYGKEITPAIRAVYLPVVNHAKAVLIGQFANRTAAAFQLLSRFDAAYQPRKLSQQALRFEDVTRAIKQGFEEGALSQVEHRLDGRLSHLLLDEFQDTSLDQWSILRRFAAQTVAPHSAGTLFCVGDVKQAIYGWRGGVSEVFDAVQQEFPQVQTSPLSKSYRSSPVVIETVNTLFKAIPTLDIVASKYPGVAARWKNWFEEHSTQKTKLPGYCCLRVAKDVGKFSENERESLRQAAADAALLARQFPSKTVGVLVRRNKSVGQIIRELRQTHNVQASEEGGNPLTDSPAVLLLISLLTLADHPGDTASRFHVALSPLGKIVELSDFTDQQRAVELSRRLRGQLLNDGYGVTLYRLVGGLAAHCNHRDLKRLMQLVELAYAWDARPTLRVDDFLRYVAQQKVQDPTTDRVRVMTIHQSKGLEFEIVVLADIGGSLTGQTPAVLVGREGDFGPIDLVCRYPNQSLASLLPPRFAQLADRHNESRASESLCVLYVAVTRAQQMLHIILPAPGKGQKGDSTAKILCAGLAPDTTIAAEHVLWEAGDATLGGVRVDPSNAEAPLAELNVIAEQPPPIQLAPMPPQRRRGLERTSPSSQEGGTHIRLEGVMRLDAPRAFEYGTLMHAWMEQIRWLEDGQPDEAMLRRIAASHATSESVISEHLATFRGLLLRNGVVDVLSRSYYASPEKTGWPKEVCRKIAAGQASLEVFNERPFAVSWNRGVLQGIVDRLVQVTAKDRLLAADIVDHKTDTVTDDTGNIDADKLAEKVEHYRPQLEAYREAVAHALALPLERVTARLVFLNAGIVKRL